MSAPSTASSTGPGAAMVLFACLSIQVGAAAAAQLFDDLGSWGASALRLLLAAALMALIIRPRMRSWNRMQWRSVLALGLALAGMNGFIYAAIQRIPLGTAVAIEFLGPLVLAAVLSRRGRDLLWVALAFVGMGLMGVESATTAARVVAEPGLLLFALAAAALSSVLPYSLEIAALRRLPSHVFSVLMSIEPAIAAVVGWVLLGQSAGAMSLTAVALVVVASAGITLGQGRPRAAPEPSAA